MTTPSTALPLWAYIVLSIGTIVGSAAGAIALLRKLGPEVQHINIETSETLVGMATKTAELYKQDAQDLRERNKILDDRLTEYAEKLGQATERINELERKAHEIRDLRDEVAHLAEERENERTEKKRLAAENAELRERVTELERELRTFRAQLPKEIL